jgi:hypothetical protein
VVQKEVGERPEILGFAWHVGRVQRRFGIAVDRSPHFRPHTLHLGVSSAQNCTAFEAIIALVAGEGFMTDVIDEKQQVIGLRLKLFRKCRVHGAILVPNDGRGK